MKAFIVYCHPSEDSFTSRVRDSFIKGIVDSGNEYVLSDLYKMNFKTDMSEQEYLRDANYRSEPDVAQDVLAEQAKINSSDAIVFIYPVFWTEAPAKLVGWFDRVWSYGFAYGENRTMKVLDKALFLVTAGNTMERLEEFGLLDSMKKVMINDRIFDRAKQSEFVLFPGMTRELASRGRDWDKNLKTAYEKGRNLLAYIEKSVHELHWNETRIKTERLELQPQGMAFFDTTHAYASDRENMRFMIHLPNDSEEATKEFLKGAEAEWKKEKPGFFEFAVLEEGKHIGGISVYLDESKTSGELGWCLAKSAQGKGYAAEAAKALVAWARKELSINKFIAHCDSENIASWKTMEKLGMKRISCTGGRFNKIAPTEERNEFLYEM